jgi:hypothetical protein
MTALVLPAAVVNLYHWLYVVVDVAPPHPPVGVALAALNNVPLVVVQVAPVVPSEKAAAQVACANELLTISRKIAMLPNIFHKEVRMGKGIFIYWIRLGYRGFLGIN